MLKEDDTIKGLLERAARAAKMFVDEENWPYSDPFDPSYRDTFYDPEKQTITGMRLWYDNDGEIGGTEECTWNPLNDDGDALRLAVDCKIIRCHMDLFHQFYDEEIENGLELHAATRWAFTRAAATRYSGGRQ